MSIRQPTQVVEAVSASAAGTITFDIAMKGHGKVRVHFKATDDGDGGSYNYTVKYVPKGMAARAFTPAIAGTLTVGGAVDATAEINEPYETIRVAIDTNTCLATVVYEVHP
ncbi:MAG: hypothetical protein AMXMBFR64_62160 [Myxococcales bacterium]